MRFLFSTGALYPPHTYGGAELSMHELAAELVRRGHDCEAISRRRGWLGRSRPDGRNGYPTWRALDVAALVAERVRAARPQLVVTWNERCVAIARAAAAAGVPVLAWVPDVGFRHYIDWLPPGTTLTCASRFVAGELRARMGREAAVLYPFVAPRAPTGGRRAPEHVTFLNPQLHKGAETVLDTAALLPRRRFLIVDSPALGRRERGRLRARAARLENVTLSPPLPSLAPIWARSAVLFCPSRVPEASPRVILEAQAAGVPVVASATGGIPEILGAGGGTLLPADAPPAAWAAAIEAVLADPPAVAGPRPELSPERVADAFLELAAGSA